MSRKRRWVWRLLVVALVGLLGFGAYTLDRMALSYLTGQRRVPGRDFLGNPVPDGGPVPGFAFLGWTRPSEEPQGLRILRPWESGREIGLRSGDVITRVDGALFTNGRDLHSLFVTEYEAGDAVRLTLEREGEPPRDVQLILKPFLRNPADLGLPYRDVEIESSSGFKLQGWFVPPPEGSDGRVGVFVHGAKSSRFQALEGAKHWYRRGYGLLTMDLSGRGTSEGEFVTYSVNERLDVASMTKWVRQQESVRPDAVVVFGTSNGAASAIFAAAQDPALAALALDAPYSDLWAAAGEMLSSRGVSSWLRSPLSLAVRWRAGIDLRAIRPADAQTQFYSESADMAGAPGWYCALAFDAQGRPHIAYWEAVGDDLKYAVRRNGAWQTEIVDGAGGENIGEHCALALDAQGNPHISYYDGTNQRLKYATKSAGSWTIEVADGTFGSGQATDIVLDGLQQPFISHWNAPNTEIRHTYQSGGVWTNDIITGIATNVTDTRVLIRSTGVIDWAYRAGNSIAHPSGGFLAPGFDFGLALDGNSQPQFAYYDSSTPELRAQNETVTTTGVTADMSISFAYAPDGSPHLAYNWGSGVLSYATKTGSWTTQQFPYPEINAVFNSIAVDAYGNPGIAYFDPAGDDLGFLHAGILLTSALDGVTWPVGAERTIEWRGAGTVGISLSVDGGASWRVLVSSYGVGNQNFGGYTFTVPHTPSKFCKVKVERSSPLSVAVSEALFTIEANISLLNLVINSLDDGGAVASWATDPGPDDLAAYRLEKRGASLPTWTTLAETSATTYHDPNSQPGDRYRLIAVNGLGHEYPLGEAVAAASLPPRLVAWPSPYRDGPMSISFVANPFAGEASVEVSIYDVAGRFVRAVANDRYPRGVHVVTWDGLDSRGARVSSGHYFIRVRSGETIETHKVVVVR